MKPVESLIILPSQERFINPALAFIRAIAASCGFSGQALNDIEVASEEALTNVIKHAFEGHCDETFKLSVSFTEEDLMITVHEKGMPFSPGSVAGYDPAKLENSWDTAGLGVYLMKKTMDDVVFENLGREGKSLTLIKHITDGDIKRSLENSGNEALIKKGPEICADDVSYEVRPFESKDALEISRCAYKAYGYTYEPYIYYPEKIIEMNRDGKLRSFIAAGKNTGEIMGHIALKYKNQNDNMAELGVAFVKPEYRKAGILKAMTSFCHEKALELKLFGLFVKAVTSHIGSQKALEPLGYVSCGIFLGLFPDDVDFKSLTGKIRQKESGLLFYRPVSEETERLIYVPSRHKDKISDMFAALKIAVRFAENEAFSAAGQSAINISVVPVLNIADAEIASIGSDVSQKLKAVLYDLRLKHVDAIFFHIDMEDVNASFAAGECEKLGFFFSGVLPFGLNGRHELILQYMNNLDINYDAIKPFSRSAQEILNYVRSLDPGKTQGDV